MADIKISALPGASTLTGAETIPLVQGGTTKKVTTDQFLIKDAIGNVGVGTASPTHRIDAVTDGGTCYARTSNGTITSFSGVAASVGGAVYGTGTNHPVVFLSNGTERARIDSAGNLGLGVVPKTSTGSYKAFEIGAAGNLSAVVSGVGTTLNSNTFVAAGAIQTYAVTGAAATYELGSGTHAWYTAPSGTAGNPISFTQAMTLDASGDLTTANDRINLITVGRGGGGVASNTASGVTALYSNTTGSNNTASGASALRYNTTGYNNTASGRSGYNPDNDIAQYRITTDFDMTLVGYGATKDNAGQLWNSTAIGARAKVTKSNQVVLGDSNVTETLINGDLVQKVSTTAATLDTNGTLTFSVVNDTTLRISMRGSDGTTRTATVALA